MMQKGKNNNPSIYFSPNKVNLYTCMYICQ